MANPVKLAVIGAGARGFGYATYARQFPERLQIVAVADPDDFRRNKMGNLYNIPEAMRFKSYQEFVSKPKMCDAVAICTQDNLHEAPAIACAKCGYHILLEKPMAPTAQACKNIVAAVKEAGVMFAVCHVLRYTKYTEAVRNILKSGEIGEIMTIQHLEPLGYWHQAHSFVRGNWRNEAESSFMLLAKSCHDIDWLRGIMGKKCTRIQSFGSTRHFRASEKPAGAADRCVDCPQIVESFCPYSAKKIYFRDRLCKGHDKWPVSVLAPEITRETLDNALKSGPYGRCVYACDNDVVDNQIVNMTFEDGSTAQMLMTGFNFHGSRHTRIFGSHGELETDGRFVKVRHFLNDTERVIDTEVSNDGGILTGHGGGDFGLMQNFVEAVASNDPSLILTGIDETLESHLMVFAAEKSRRNGNVCDVE
ncbi:MAG: Gfo/Idh/MocA family oxidoreductase [Lentisphaerae bacterium]|nr:Gfo/Idh/MocA family oxidoreductase [Lentisphaerota bacterium]